jgi:hypothetical protein
MPLEYLVEQNSVDEPAQADAHEQARRDGRILQAGGHFDRFPGGRPQTWAWDGATARVLEAA